MADHVSVFMHCSALRGEFHAALGLSLPDALLSSTEACDRPFRSRARSMARSRSGGSQALPAGGAEEGYSVATIAEVRDASSFRTYACAAVHA